MNGWKKGAIGAAMVLACVPGTVSAQSKHSSRGPEVGAGVLAHGVALEGTPPGFFTPEQDTVDVEALWRSRPVRSALNGRVTAKLQVNTSGRTSFASIGAEWRQHVLRRRIYGPIGIGLAIHDGYLLTPDPAQATSPADFDRWLGVFYKNASFGSRVLFNPNLSVGVRLSRRWSAELAFEHYSNATLFSDTNDGIEMLGLRLVRTLGRRR